MQESEELVLLVEKAIERGLARHQVAAAVREAYAKAELSPPSAQEIDRAYEIAIARLRTHAEASFEEIHARHVAMTEHVFREAIKDRDFDAALRAADQLKRIQGQYEAHKKMREAKRPADRRGVLLEVLKGGKI